MISNRIYKLTCCYDRPRKTVLRAAVSIALCGIAACAFAQQNTSTHGARRDAIFQRRGYIKIGLPQSATDMTVSCGVAMQISCDGVSRMLPPGAVSASAAGGVMTVQQNGTAIGSGTVVTVAPNGSRLLSVGKKSYRGKFRLAANGNRVRIINELLIDDWLKGVLPAEIGEDSGLEALKAQAVAARSEAIHKLLKPPHAGEGFDFCTGVHCQAYKGVEVEAQNSNRACDETLGIVLLANGDVMDAVYSNVCGGVTAGAEDVWASPPQPGLIPVFDMAGNSAPNLGSDGAVERFLANRSGSTFCDSSNPQYANYAKKYYRWSKTISGQQLAKVARVGQVLDVRVTERKRSGRVWKLTISGTGGSKTIEKELPIRNALDLWSGLFVVRVVKNPDGTVQSATFNGAGNGHGVGLCQHGAREMSRRGASFVQILNHYFRGTEVQKIPN
jgi:stage II sporulation protein D